MTPEPPTWAEIREDREQLNRDLRADWVQGQMHTALMALIFAALAALMGYQHHALGHPGWVPWVFVPFVLGFASLSLSFVVRWARARGSDA